MKTHIDLEADERTDLVNLRTSMAIALLLVGAMLSSFAPVWGLGVELVAATAIVAIRRPWADRRPEPSNQQCDRVIDSHTTPVPSADIHRLLDQPNAQPDRAPDNQSETKLSPVFDVRADKIVGLRASLGWDAVSVSAPQCVAVDRLDEEKDTNPWVSAPLVVDEFDSDELLLSVDRFLRASGLTPERLILEIERWHESRKNRSTVDRLLDRGVAIGLCKREGDPWPEPPKTFSTMVSIYSVSASDITHRGEVTLDGMADIEAFSQTRLDRVVVRDVNHTSLALDLGSIGLKHQAGSIFDEDQIRVRSFGAFSSWKAL